MAVTYKQPVDDNVPWDQRLANYASNKDAGMTEYQRALEVYRGKSAAGDIDGANAAKKWSDQVNTAIGGIGNNRTSQVNNTLDTVGQKVNATPFEFKQTAAPFQYNAQADPSYQAALRQAQQGAQTATNNAMVGLGSRGIGNSSVAVDRANQIQQSAIGNVNDTILPQLMQQAYGRYQDQNNNDYRTQLANYQAQQDQIGNLSKYAGTLNDLNQQDFNNNLATNQDTRAQAAQDANFTGYYNDANTQAVKKQMAANSAAYASASPEEQKRLHEENVKLAASIGGTDVTGDGTYEFGQGSRTLQGQTLDNSVKQQGIDNQFKQQQIEQSAKQFAASQGLDWARLNQQQQQFVAEQAMKQQQLDAQNNPNNLDNKYKQAQIDALTAKNDKAADHGIDDYDLAMIDSLAAQQGLDLSKSNPTDIRSFVADLKTKNGWTTDEAKQVESYLTNKANASTGNSSSGGGFFPSFSMDSIKNNVQSGLNSLNELFSNLPGSGSVDTNSPGYIEYLKELAKKSNPMNLLK